MNCKCNELTTWLKKEISYLKEIQTNLDWNSKLFNIVDAKILAYTIVLEGLTN